MRKKRGIVLLLALLTVLLAASACYVTTYYRAEPAALAALADDELVRVSETDYGWFFDGPSTATACIFYPGGKVEAAAYAPLLRLLAREGMDVCLVEMPWRLAVLDIDRAAAIRERYDYENWSIGGHSLGGTCAALYAASHPGEEKGLILLAAYPTKALDPSLREILIRGSEDGVLNPQRLEAGRAFAPPDTAELVIEGGNHAQFGNYGEQRGDGDAFLSRDDQQEQTAETILQKLLG